MKKRAILLTLATLLAAVTVCFAADDVNIGTWNFNAAKSKLRAGATTNNTVVYEAMGDNVKVTVNGVDSTGKAVRSEWTGKFDGKDYPVTGDPTGDMRSYKRINAHTLALTEKKDGKVTETGRIVVAADGMSRTVSVTVTDAKGMKMTSTAVYDKKM